MSTNRAYFSTYLFSYYYCSVPSKPVGIVTSRRSGLQCVDGKKKKRTHNFSGEFTVRRSLQMRSRRSSQIRHGHVPVMCGNCVRAAYCYMWTLCANSSRAAPCYTHAAMFVSER
jgi:hypothetical protein